MFRSVLSFFQTPEFWAAAVGAGATLAAAYWALSSALRNLANHELKRRRVACVCELIGNRHALLPSAKSESETRELFLRALNGVPAVFGDIRLVMDAHNMFLQSVQENASPEIRAQANQRMLELIRRSAAEAGVPLLYVTNDQILKSMS